MLAARVGVNGVGRILSATSQQRLWGSGPSLGRTRGSLGTFHCECERAEGRGDTEITLMPCQAEATSS